MVIDENRRGWPVARLITSRSDAATLQFFFQTLKARTTIDMSNVITDDDAALINAMDAGFSTKMRHILCKWHVLKNFKENLHKKVPNSMVEQMMAELRVIVNAKEESTFLKLCEGFVLKYEENRNTARFVKYFKQYYLNSEERMRKWAMCYRNFPHGQVNTTGHIESFHNRLKKNYLKRKVNKRLDDLINILCEMEWEDYCTRTREACLGLTALPQSTLERHQRSTHIPDDFVEKLDDDHFEIKSSTTEGDFYAIVRHITQCTADLCFAKCQSLPCSGLCAHLYYCSCYDTHPLCKHIHKIHSYLTRVEPKSIQDSDFYVSPHSEESEAANEAAQEDPTTTSSLHVRRYNNMIARLEEIFIYLNNFMASARCQEVEERALADLDSGISELVNRLHLLPSASIEESQSVPLMSPAEDFNSNEKLKTQLSQLAPFKRPVGKNTKEHKDPAELAIKNASIVKNLLGHFNKGGEH